MGPVSLPEQSPVPAAARPGRVPRRPCERAGRRPNMHFASWMRAVFGAGITRHFMDPYNFKVWATHPAKMSADWIAERVSVIDYERVLANVARVATTSPGDRTTRFVFPALGGTGEIYRRLALKLNDRIRFGAEVVGVDPSGRAVSPQRWRRASLRLARLDDAARPAGGHAARCPDALAQAATLLRHNGVYMVGVGYETPLPTRSRGCTSPSRTCPSTARPTSPSTRRRTSPTPTRRVTAPT